jgi:hypothetical protein
MVLVVVAFFIVFQLMSSESIPSNTLKTNSDPRIAIVVSFPVSPSVFLFQAVPRCLLLELSKSHYLSS